MAAVTPTHYEPVTGVVRMKIIPIYDQAKSFSVSGQTVRAPADIVETERPSDPCRSLILAASLQSRQPRLPPCVGRSCARRGEQPGLRRAWCSARLDETAGGS